MEEAFRKINIQWLQVARESRAITISSMAKKLKIKPWDYQRMEWGLVDCSKETLNKISEILNYPLSFFFQECAVYPIPYFYYNNIRIR